jgi:Putative Actinobacterial Holin-X, holin superfamily III/WS/DGAT C-terminal domain
MGLFPPPVQRRTAARLYQRRWFSMLVSIFPGARRSHLVLGVGVEEVYPVLALADGVGLAVGAMTWERSLSVGILADAALVPDADRLAAELTGAFERYRAPAGSQGAGTAAIGSPGVDAGRTLAAASGSDGNKYGGNVTETPESPQAGIAEALGDLSEQTRILVRREIDTAQREMWEKAKESVPALALLGAAGALGLLAAASAYRLTLRLLERHLSPASAAFTATVCYGAGAAGAAVAGGRRLRELPSPFPAETARQAGKTLTAAAAEARR